MAKFDAPWLVEGSYAETLRNLMAMAEPGAFAGMSPEQIREALIDELRFISPYDEKEEKEVEVYIAGMSPEQIREVLIEERRFISPHSEKEEKEAEEYIHQPGGVMAEARIPLSDLIAELRKELTTAKAQGEGQDLKLQVEEAEVELQVVVTQEEGMGGGVKFWVLNFDANEKSTNATTQKIKLKLKPLDAEDNTFKMGRTK
jgi:predicted ATP-dependent Lon-type protease